MADFVAEKLFSNNITQLGDALSNVQPANVNKFKQFILNILQKLKDVFAKRSDKFVDIASIEKEFIKTCEAAKKAWEQKQQTTEQQKTSTESGGTINFSLMNDKSFSENVDDILAMSDAEARSNAEEGNFVRIMENTPSVVLDNVSNSENLEVIVSFYSLYLATRKSGALEGHYHDLGDLIKNLPEYISNPQAIVKMDNGRVNLFNQIETSRGKNGILSIELNTVKDINNKYDKYNLVITVYSANDNHTKNNIENRGVKVEYEKEDLSQVNPQLHKWLAIVNERSSEYSIPNSPENVKVKLEDRVSGDDLLNAQDLIEEIESVGGEVDENGYVTVYHRTTEDAKQKILSTGKMSAKEDGIFFSTKTDGQTEGYGDAIVELRIPVENLVLDDIFDDEAHLRYPLANRNSTLDVSEYISTPDNGQYSLSDNENIPAQMLHYTKMYSDAMNDPKIKELYEKAKSGDDKAAFELANYCFTDDFVKEIAERYEGCYFVSVNGAQGTSLNVMPIVIADVLSQKTGLAIFRGVFKTSKNNMQSKSTADRLSEKVSFDTTDDTVYNNIKGKKFVIVDDTVSTGTTTNSLARYLESAGGEVSGTVSLFKGQDHYNNLAITKETLKEIERRIGRENAEQLIKEYEYADRLEQLTEKQAKQLLRIGRDDQRGRQSDARRDVQSIEESGGRVLSETSGETKKNSTRGKADLNDESAFSMPESKQYSISDNKQYSLPDNFSELSKMFKNGQLTEEEFRAALEEKSSDDNPVSIANLKPEDANTTPELTRKEDTNQGNKTSNLHASLLGSSIFNDEFKKDIKDDSYIKSYQAVTNKESLRKAADKLDEGGRKAVEQWWSRPSDETSLVNVNIMNLCSFCDCSCLAELDDF